MTGCQQIQNMLIRMEIHDIFIIEGKRTSNRNIEFLTTQFKYEGTWFL
jgi:hypothetical protein